MSIERTILNSVKTLTSGYYLDRGKHLFVKVWGSEGWMELNPGTANPLEWYSNE